MELWVKYAAVALLSYLLGSLNFAIILSKILMKKDVRQYGSGNAGSTNAYRLMGGKKTILVMIGDILKGVAAVLIAGAVFNEGGIGGDARMIAGAAVVVGHVFPLYFGFRGGKGVLTTGAVLAVVDIRLFIIVFVAFIIGFACTRFVSFGSMCSAVALPIASVIFYLDKPVGMVVGIFLGAFVFWLHRGNLKRIINGTESKFTFKKKKSE